MAFPATGTLNDQETISGRTLLCISAPNVWSDITNSGVGTSVGVIISVPTIEQVADSQQVYLAIPSVTTSDGSPFYYRFYRYGDPLIIVNGPINSGNVANTSISGEAPGTYTYSVEIYSDAEGQQLELSYTYDPFTVVDNSAISNYPTTIGAADAQYRALLDELHVSSASPVAPSGNDFSVTNLIAVTGDPISITVRKPTLSGTTRTIGTIPADESAAWSYINDEIQAAVDNNDSRILFPANQTLRLLAPTGIDSSAANLPIEDLTDCEIDLNGSTLEYVTLGPGMIIKNCQRVSIKNGGIRGTFVGASVATVEYDSSPGGIKFNLLSEWAEHFGPEDTVTPENNPTIETVGKVREYNGSYEIEATDAIDLFTNRTADQNQFVYKTSGSSPNLSAWFESTSALVVDVDPPFAEGQLVYLLHENNSGHAFVLKNDDGNVEDISIENMTLENIPGMGISGGLNRGLYVNNLSINRDVNNPLSFLGSTSDAFHLNNNGGDIVLENSSIFNAADDLFTIKGNWWLVAEVVGNTVSIDNVGSKKYGVNLSALAGNKIVLVRPDLSVFGTATATVNGVEGGNYDHEITVDAIPAGFGVGDLFANPDFSGGRVLVRNNSFRSSRAQGMLLQTQHMIIQNNTITNIAGPGLKLNMSLEDWYEGVCVQNVLLDNNTLTDTALSQTKPPYPIYIHNPEPSGSVIDLIENVDFSTTVSTTT